MATKHETSTTKAPAEKLTQAQRREKAERKMLKAAVQLVTQKGLAGLTLNDVGEAAGYSRGLPAHYFGRKDTLIARLGQYIVDRYSIALLKDGSIHFDDGLDAIIKSADYYLQSVEADPTTMKALIVLLTEANNYPDLLPAIVELNNTSVKRFAEPIIYGQKKGDINPDLDTETQAMLILGQLRGTSAQWLLAPKTINMQKLRESMKLSLRRSLEP